jgi:hypothetical protein
MPTLTGVVLTEIVGRDVISWRVTPDTFHELTYSVDTADVSGVVVLDGQGCIEDTQVIHYVPSNKTIVHFKTRSDYYALLYRRNNFVEESGGVYTYNDTWRYQGHRFHNWFFPPTARLDSLTPAALHALQGWREGQPVVSHLTPGLTIEVRYRLDGAPADPPPVAGTFDLAPMLRQIAPPDGAATEALRRATAAAPEFDRLLAGSIALRALLTPDAAR